MLRLGRCPIVRRGAFRRLTLGLCEGTGFGVTLPRFVGPPLLQRAIAEGRLFAREAPGLLFRGGESGLKRHDGITVGEELFSRHTSITRGTQLDRDALVVDEGRGAGLAHIGHGGEGDELGGIRLIIEPPRGDCLVRRQHLSQRQGGRMPAGRETGEIDAGTAGLHGGDRGAHATLGVGVTALRFEYVQECCPAGEALSAHGKCLGLRDLYRCARGENGLLRQLQIALRDGDADVARVRRPAGARAVGLIARLRSHIGVAGQLIRR